MKKLILSIILSTCVLLNVNAKTLGDSIIENAKNHATDLSTVYSENPLTSPAGAISGVDERTLSKTTDDYGDSYYFRGNVQDNYLNFDGMCFRIVRIQGDGSIKIILYDKSNVCEKAIGGPNASIGKGLYGYKKGSINNKMLDYVGYENLRGVRVQIQNWVNTLKNKSLLKKEDWCIGDTHNWYDKSGLTSTQYEKILYSEARKRISGYGVATNANLNCNEKYDEKVNDFGGLLTVDEVAFAGANIESSNRDMYLTDSFIRWWLLTPESRNNYYDNSFYFHSNGRIDYADTIELAIRPVIVLNKNIDVEGTGFINDPYNIVNTYTVSYKIEGEVLDGINDPESEEYLTGTEVNVLNDLKLKGYKFSGWTTKDVEVKDGKFIMPKKDVLFVGRFEKEETTKEKAPVKTTKKTTTKKVKKEEIKNPQTWDSTIKTLILIVISIVTLVAVNIRYKAIKNK